jgi:hypothetical protein
LRAGDVPAKGGGPRSRRYPVSAPKNRVIRFKSQNFRNLVGLKVF